jgi:hypothetical protein
MTRFRPFTEAFSTVSTARRPVRGRSLLAGKALHVLDRFLVTMHLNQGVDRVRCAETVRLRAVSHVTAQQLKHTRWALLRRAAGYGAGPAKAQRTAGQQALDCTGLGVERNLLAFLDLAVRDLGRSVSRLLVLPGDAQPSRGREESRSDAPQPMGLCC